MSCAIRSTRRLKENDPGIPWEGLFPEPPLKESEHVGFPRPSLSYALLGPAVKGPIDKRSPKSGGSGRHAGLFGGNFTQGVI